MNRRLTATAVTVCAALASTLLHSPSATAESAATETGATVEPAASPLRLVTPTRLTTESYRQRVYLDLGVRLVAQDAPFELWSNRASFDEPITTEWRGTSGNVALPAGTLTSFNGLPRFLSVQIRDRAGELLYARKRTVCLNGEAERIAPDAEPRSAYPWGCPFHPFTLGSVMGIQAGWANRIDTFGRPVPLKAGRYQVSLAITPRYRTMFGISEADAVSTTALRVVAYRDFVEEPHAHSARMIDDQPDPAAAPPEGAETAVPAGPVPNLKSLPAFEIQVSPNGRFLQFAATVWNAGDSPLVVDGFRRQTEDVMDAYQYFFDTAGNQVGYNQVGEMEWDTRDTHQHWHFRDFARYRLLDADQTGVRRSKKEAFCLANTDAVDYTVPGANWRPDGTDLHTACGDYGSLSVREVLDAGSGDTYAQYRAGQSFNLTDLPNGIYYVAVEANPMGRLIESSTDDNTALRKVRLGGTPDHRRVRVFPVGLIP